ncbi:hypothetical protein HDU87_003220 [Geranomyces variabilis]|uniref:OBG-type G domain-containing protein n=1 Tax=Geranomyces variabilis TaxID=109894 RepID=A0AAD5XMS0_9FUNG|nr:hypothetical protein HDU87_003220 [Geranomyces variabilis]
MHGAEGRDLEVVVPVGTLVRFTDPPVSISVGHEDRGAAEDVMETHEGEEQQLDEDEHANDERMRLIDKYYKFGSGYIPQADRIEMLMERLPQGQLGTTVWLELELKTIAKAGLVGLPNAGKSTFLAAVSNAHPKIAPYPFTTLNPYVGTIDFPDFWIMTVADIPGLIQGAHRNVGLGHRFLRHVERNRMLVYVLDFAALVPWDDLAVR